MTIEAFRITAGSHADPNELANTILGRFGLRNRCENCKLKLLALVCLGFGACNSSSVDASNLSCSSAETKSAVIGVEKRAFKTAPMLSDFFDFESSAFSIESVRTEGNDGFKIECVATLLVNPVARDLGPSADKNAAKMLDLLVRPFKEGVPVHYTVQNTDDGKLYVEVKK